MTTGNISLLLGSGFSIPEGLPNVGFINKKLSNLKGVIFIYFLTKRQVSITRNGKTLMAGCPALTLTGFSLKSLSPFIVRNI